MFGWLLSGMRSLFEWLFSQIVSLVQWLVGAVGWVIQKVLNQIQAVTVLLLAGFSGYAPTQTLQAMWSQIVSGWTWLNPNAVWVALYWIDLPEMFARMTYFAEALIAAYVLRLVFSAVRAVFDLL